MAKKKIDPHERFKRWHWGLDSTKEISVPTPPYPKEMVEIGRLMEFKLSPKQRPRRGQRYNKNNFDIFDKSFLQDTSSIEIDQKNINDNYVVFDHNDKHDRIYFINDKGVKDVFKSLYKDLDTSTYSLHSLAKLAGGNHKKNYPSGIKVKPIGYVKDIVYFTHKKGDVPPLPYIHAMGEENGSYPILACDRYGRLWYCGGTYTCPYAGITN
jgi:hypothetical protein